MMSLCLRKAYEISCQKSQTQNRTAVDPKTSVIYCKSLVFLPAKLTKFQALKVFVINETLYSLYPATEKMYYGIPA